MSGDKVRTRGERWIFAACVLLTILPIGVSAARRALSQWEPVADDADLGRYVYDVFTRHTPLLGMPSTIGSGRWPWPHHPGPMLFWVLSVPFRLLGSTPVGLAAGAAAVNAAALVGVVVLLRRRLGTTVALCVAAVLAVVSAALGQETLSSISNPSIAILPLALFVLLVWMVASGETLALPFCALVASFVVQAHMVYTPIVVALGLWGIVGLVWTYRRERGASPSPRPVPWRRDVGATALVLAVCWSTAIYQVLTKFPGGGNVTAILHGVATNDTPPLGLSTATHLVVNSVMVFPLFVNTGAPNAYARLSATPSVPTIIGAALVVAVFAVALARAWRRDPLLRSLLITTAVTSAVTLWTVSRLPRGWTGSAVPALVQFLSMTGPLIWLALGVALIRLVTFRPAARVVQTGALAALLVFAVVVASVRHTPTDLKLGDRSTIVRSLARQLRARLPRHQTYLFLQVLGASQGVDIGVMFDLARHGYDLTEPVDDPYFGELHPAPKRRLPLVFVVDHRRPFEPLPGGTHVASYRPRGRDARDAAAALQRACDALAAHPPSVTVIGRALVARLPRASADLVRRVDAGTADPCRLALDPALPGLLRFGVLRAPSVDDAAVERAQAMQADVAAHSFDAYLVRNVEPYEVSAFRVPGDT